MSRAMQCPAFNPCLPGAVSVDGAAEALAARSHACVRAGLQHSVTRLSAMCVTSLLHDACAVGLLHRLFARRTCRTG
jgi:hypothetical protein